jgi:hypothetical protein
MARRHTDVPEKLRHQRELNHSIPDAIFELTGELGNVRYRSSIADFSSSYFEREFGTLEDEFLAIRDFEVRLIEECLGVNVAKTINHIMKGELAAVAIDENLQQETLLPIELRDEPKTTTIAGNLASFYNHVQSGGHLESWTSTNSAPNHPLASILLSNLKKKNHGVVGGLTLLAYDLLDETNIPAVYSTALAIALHDRKPREELLQNNIFPVTMERFPLVVLMLYCDVLQEWNRSTTSTAELVDFQFLERGIVFVLKFSSDRARKMKEQEFSDVSRCIGTLPISLMFANATSVGSQRAETND